MKALLKYPGAKWSTADWIIKHFPSDYEKMTYLEPFFGSGAILFNKNRSKIETINDLDSRVYNFFCQVREKPEELSELIKYTPWSREEYENSYEVSADKLEDARRFLVRMWQGIGSKTADITGWSNNIKPIDTGISRWKKLSPEIKAAAKRLNGQKLNIVQIENSEALTLIKRYNRKECLIYLDPPYLLRTRNKRIYKHEMNNDDHIELLETIKDMKAKIIISGYDDKMYNEILSGWNKSYRESNTEMGGKRIEVIWYNYKANVQLSIFDLE